MHLTNFFENWSWDGKVMNKYTIKHHITISNENKSLCEADISQVINYKNEARFNFLHKEQHVETAKFESLTRTYPKILKNSLKMRKWLTLYDGVKEVSRNLQLR